MITLNKILKNHRRIKLVWSGKSSRLPGMPSPKNGTWKFPFIPLKPLLTRRRRCFSATPSQYEFGVLWCPKWALEDAHGVCTTFSNAVFSRTAPSSPTTEAFAFPPSKTFQFFSWRKTWQKSAHFRAGSCLNPYPTHYKLAFAFFYLPLPAALSANLAVSFPRGRATGLPSSV